LMVLVTEKVPVALNWFVVSYAQVANGAATFVDAKLN
jgi:hypothetical protein